VSRGNGSDLPSSFPDGEPLLNDVSPFLVVFLLTDFPQEFTDFWIAQNGRLREIATCACLSTKPYHQKALPANFCFFGRPRIAVSDIYSRAWNEKLCEKNSHTASFGENKVTNMVWKSYARKRNSNVPQRCRFPGDLRKSSGKIMWEKHEKYSEKRQKTKWYSWIAAVIIAILLIIVPWILYQYNSAVSATLGYTGESWCANPYAYKIPIGIAVALGIFSVLLSRLLAKGRSQWILLIIFETIVLLNTTFALLIQSGLCDGMRWNFM